MICPIAINKTLKIMKPTIYLMGGIFEIEILIPWKNAITNLSGLAKRNCRPEYRKWR